VELCAGWWSIGFFTNKEVKQDNELKILFLIIFLILATCFSAQIKLNNLTQLPIAILKDEKNPMNWYILDGSQDKFILLNRDSKKMIKVVKFEEIDRIISNKK